MNKKGILTIFIALFVAAIFGLIYIYTTNFSLLSPARETFVDTRSDAKITTEQETKTEKPFVLVREQKVYVEIADTIEKRSLGLSNRDSLPEDEGMLFTYEVSNQPTFWMKDMLFDLDIIWIQDNKIVKIDKSVPAPESQMANKDLTLYEPGQNIDRVLEVSAGFSDKYDIQVGDDVSPIQAPEGSL